MPDHAPSAPRFRFPAILLGLLACFAFQPVAAASGREEGKPRVRFVCVSCLGGDQEVVLASRDEQGNWREHATFHPGSPLITDWLPAEAGNLHLALREADALKSIGHFTFPAATKRILAVLFPNPAKNGYLVDLVDPAKLQFAKGSTLLVNYSTLPATVVLGALKTRLKPGEHTVVRPVPEANGMYRMLAAYTDANKGLVPCYDRYVSSNQDSRDLIFLLADPALGLKVFSLSEFGPFD